MKQIITKIGLFLAYSLFAGWSAKMTATSLHATQLKELNYWLAFAMVFIIALLAGWCLDNAIKQLKNSITPNKSIFLLSLGGFLLFWGVSFLTNVHYNFVTKYGYDNINRQVQSCKEYLRKETTVKNDDIENEKNRLLQKVTAEYAKREGEIYQELTNPSDGGKVVGLGPVAQGHIRNLEKYFNDIAKVVNDTMFVYEHTIYNPNSSDKEYTTWRSRQDIARLYNDILKARMEKNKDHLSEAIVQYYELKKENNDSYKELLNAFIKFEEKGLSQLSQENDFNTIHQCYNNDLNPLLGKMPAEYANKNIRWKTNAKNAKGEKVFDGYIVYPSERMFDWWTVRGDWMNGYLPDYTNYLSGMPMALIIDIVSFILICMVF
ncbi:MAG: hypothetical protein IJ762_09475 [Bacteroidaceae bacterium]|nr:hypothetical protein [Bacteroidaceae bacterium]